MTCRRFVTSCVLLRIAPDYQPCGVGVFDSTDTLPHGTHYLIQMKRTRKPCLPLLLLFGALCVGTQARAQARAAPSSDLPLSPLETLVRESELGDIRERPMKGDDVELRVWRSGGFAGMGENGVIIRRKNGRWYGWRARAEPCTKEMANTDPPPRHCSTAEPPTAPAFGAGVLVTEEIQPPSAIRDAWAVAVRHHVHTLPRTVQGQYLRKDGFSSLIQLRRGSEYRYTWTDDLDSPRTSEERRASAIVTALFNLP
jgi:hypothetical protein